MSDLQRNPKSKILVPGYINIYSKLTPQEQKQINFKTKYKKLNPSWDETQVFLSKKFAELVKKDSMILDAGCGNGNYVIDENRRSIAWAVGIDLDEEFVKKNICLDEIKIGNLEHLPFEDNKFDAVISLWVLEHVENPVKIFSEVRKVLKPGGIFLFATPNANFIPLKIIKLTKLSKKLNKVLFGRREEDVFETHYKANTINDLKNPELVEGFEIITLKTNYDPAYTSFNTLTFRFSNLLNKLIQPHIVGILRKI